MSRHIFLAVIDGKPCDPCTRSLTVTSPDAALWWYRINLVVADAFANAWMSPGSVQDGGDDD